MWYLYFGYLTTQLYGFFEVLSGIRFVWSVHFFSTIVFVIWTFFPVFGYIAAKVAGAKGNLIARELMVVGIIIGLIEKSLYQFHLLNFYQNNSGAYISALLMFSVGFIVLKRKKLSYS